MHRDLYTSCDEDNTAFIVRMRAVGNLLSQSESAESGLFECQEAFDSNVENFFQLGVETANSSFSDGMCSGGDVEILVDMEGSTNPASFLSQRYVMYSPCASTVGALGFFTCSPLLRNEGCEEESVVVCTDDSQSVGKDCIQPRWFPDVKKGGNNFVVDGLCAKLSEDISALVSDLTECAKRVKRDSLAALESVMTFSHALPLCSSVGALSRPSQASVGGRNVPLAQLSQLLARHGSLLALVASVTSSDFANMDSTGGARYKLLDIIASMRDTVAGWFDEEMNDSDANRVSRLSAVRLPERLARLGAVFPQDVLELVDTFLASTEGLTCSFSHPSPAHVPPFLLSELVVMAADGLTIMWPMLFASHPELQWELEL